jgi:hypothetical protein
MDERLYGCMIAMLNLRNIKHTRVVCKKIDQDSMPAKYKQKRQKKISADIVSFIHDGGLLSFIVCSPDITLEMYISLHGFFSTGHGYIIGILTCDRNISVSKLVDALKSTVFHAREMLRIHACPSIRVLSVEEVSDLIGERSTDMLSKMLSDDITCRYYGFLDKYVVLCDDDMRLVCF